MCYHLRRLEAETVPDFVYGDTARVDIRKGSSATLLSVQLQHCRIKAKHKVWVIFFSFQYTSSSRQNSVLIPCVCLLRPSEEEKTHLAKQTKTNQLWFLYNFQMLKSYIMASTMVLNLFVCFLPLICPHPPRPEASLTCFPFALLCLSARGMNFVLEILGQV